MVIDFFGECQTYCVFGTEKYRKQKLAIDSGVVREVIG